MAALVPELSVSDMTVSRRFYCDIIGFALRYERPEEGFAYLELGAAELMLDQLGTGREWITAPLERPFGRGVNFQIEVDAVAPILDRLAVAGIAPFLPLETKTYSTLAGDVAQRQFCVTDPDGYLLRFFETLS
ncbi:bleomycin resistance protein [Devosia sp. SL43]|uniref:bleomycin resistance protein n=1 Tax=Devosia sp. SL43 TaxID=2806348 RepID=UPI001F1610D7|nr:VOC family protein [Devosia sp. SL43]UJW84289.1 VOC family protein [Devosia sp. SL43]